MTSYASYRVIPFATFMAFIGGEEVVRFFVGKGLANVPTTTFLYLYPLRVVAVGLLLAVFWKHYEEIRIHDLLRYRETALSIGVGVLIFILWINMPWTLGASGPPVGYNPTAVSDFFTRNFLIAIRLFGAVLVVPVMEELFWRSFLLRYLIGSDITKIPIGTFSWFSLLAGSLLFGLEHDYLYAGIMAGIGYSLLLYGNRSLTLCMLSHGTTNLLLGAYVLKSNQWQFW